MQALPDDINELKQLLTESREALAAAEAALQARDQQIEALKLQIAKLERMRFGRSEQLEAQIAQLELELGALQGNSPVPVSSSKAVSTRRAPVRRPLPEHFPREEVRHEPAGDCPDCGTKLEPLGEDVAELLEYEPARFKVIRHVRPKLACAGCQTIVQEPAPSRPIERGLAGRGCWPTCWSPSMPTTCHCTRSVRSTPGRGSNWNVPLWPAGSAAQAAC